MSVFIILLAAIPAITMLGVFAGRSKDIREEAATNLDELLFLKERKEKQRKKS